MGFKTGDTEMFMWSETEKELYKLNSDKIDEHEDELMSIDMLESKGLFVTGGRDGLVKVWNIKKQLIREIKFPSRSPLYVSSMPKATFSLATSAKCLQ